MGDHFLISNGTVHYSKERSVVVNKIPMTGTLYYFLDCSRDCRLDDVFLRAELVVCVSSPNEENYKHVLKTFQNHRNYNQYYMNVWSWIEISALSKIKTEPIEDLRKKFDVCGGNVRYLFSGETLLTMKEKIEGKCESADYKSLLDSVNSTKVRIDSTGKKFSHSIIQLNPFREYLSYTYGFVSDFVVNAVYVGACKRKVDGVIEVINDMKGSTILASARGQLFEKYSHDVLSSQERSYV